jgi:hypothetical protein
MRLHHFSTNYRHINDSNWYLGYSCLICVWFYGLLEELRRLDSELLTQVFRSKSLAFVGTTTWNSVSMMKVRLLIGVEQRQHSKTTGHIDSSGISGRRRWTDISSEVVWENKETKKVWDLMKDRSTGRQWQWFDWYFFLRIFLKRVGGCPLILVLIPPTRRSYNM